jgi:hypothetical protein
MPNTTTVQAVVPADVAEQFEALATKRGMTVSALARHVLTNVVAADGTFFGVMMQSASAVADRAENEWFSTALSYPAVDVIDGALVFRGLTGEIEAAIAPGRWRECSRRLNIDRPVFDK